jgi:hypothetical protein
MKATPHASGAFDERFSAPLEEFWGGNATDDSLMFGVLNHANNVASTRRRGLHLLSTCRHRHNFHRDATSRVRTRSTRSEPAPNRLVRFGLPTEVCRALTSRNERTRVATKSHPTMVPSVGFTDALLRQSSRNTRAVTSSASCPSRTIRRACPKTRSRCMSKISPNAAASSASRATTTRAPEHRPELSPHLIMSASKNRFHPSKRSR